MKRISKKKLIAYFYEQMDRIHELYFKLRDYIENPTGDIEANLTLSKKSNLWKMNITAGDKTYINLTSDLGFVLDMIHSLRKVYDFDIFRKEENDENDT